MRVCAQSAASLLLLLCSCKPVPTEARMAESVRSFEANQRQLLERQATFDLDCSAKQLEWAQLSDQIWGVRGCGKRVRYVLQCQHRVSQGLGVDDFCNWLRDSAVELVDRPREDEPRAPPSDQT